MDVRKLFRIEINGKSAPIITTDDGLPEPEPEQKGLKMYVLDDIIPADEVRALEEIEGGTKIHLTAGFTIEVAAPVESVKKELGWEDESNA
ncbi:hypothetical protein [Bacillus atrophaeus]|uniref:hypothetical protein n=1 Tax=Bacillus atrophaeus TaxID=1452 RepID=UPI00227F6E2F|nr:hypothetical protein [Bacillus atrophaeus]MCY8466496.1 hypothetical protein [Bacillus atrophaeus]MCY8478955.1 hypothetical protein [Bacillus atrophaeus]